MRRLVLILAKFIGVFSTTFKNYVLEWKIAGRDPGLYFTNILFQRIFRTNSDVKFLVHFTSKIGAFQKIKYNKDAITMKSFFISGGCYFQALNGIILGKNFLFAPGLKMISSNHSKENTDDFVEAKPIIIGDNVWIGTNVVILPSVEIGNNCIVGAGSVVTKSFKENNLVIAGNPAKIIKQND